MQAQRPHDRLIAKKAVTKDEITSFATAFLLILFIFPIRPAYLFLYILMVSVILFAGFVRFERDSPLLMVSMIAAI